MPITEVTRRGIVDELHVRKIAWSGRFSETDFLSRVYDLNALPSSDSRHKTARSDIAQHRISFQDWEDDWIFSDRRFKLNDGPDDVFLRFLVEMVHPAVRPNEAETIELLAIFNRYLQHDGWEIFQVGNLSARPIFGARRVGEGSTLHLAEAQKVADAIDSEYIAKQVDRIREALAREDTELAIGTSKELVESVCKTILRCRGELPPESNTLPALVKKTAKVLRLGTDGGPAATAGSASTVRIANSLGTLADAIGEFRNNFGSGHGKDADSATLEMRYARLALGASSALASFLLETHQQTPGTPGSRND